LDQKTTQIAELWEILEPYLAAERLELDDLELSGHGRGRILRVIVDGDGVDIERLAEVSRGLSRLLDNETELDGSYQLEVSSPGLERKLRRPNQFMKSMGREVVAKVKEGEANKTLRGNIVDAGDRSFTVEGSEGKFVVNYGDVVSARTVYRWERAPKPGH
jgi:ribosome maturation factor RimP